MSDFKKYNKNKWLVADVGGTHLRIGVAGIDSATESVQVDHVCRHRCEDADSLIQTISQYRQQDSVGQDLDRACIAVAGPVHEGSVKMTNLDWVVSQAELEQQLGLASSLVINDFAALAESLPVLDASFLKPLKGGHSANGGSPGSPCKVIIGPGTGFGVAALHFTRGQWQVLPGEGGHITLAASTSIEREILSVLYKQHEHISIETVLSGSGLVRIYKSLAVIYGKPMQALSPGDISQRAISGEDDIAVRALTVFCEWLGTVARDVALLFGAQGGVYLAGGVLPKIIDFLQGTHFIDRFCCDKGVSTFTETVPISLVISDVAALVGCGAYALNYMRENDS